MHYYFLCKDREDAGTRRPDNREAHLTYLRSFGDKILAGGPILKDGSDQPGGSLLIVDLPDDAAAEAFVKNDPYGQAELFESVEWGRWRQVIPAP